MPEEGAAPRSRPLWIVVVLLGISAALLWGASRSAGGDSASGLTALALVALAAIAAVIAIGGMSRRVLGGLLCVAGLAIVWLGIAGIDPASARILTGIAGLAVAAAGGLTVRFGARMSRLGATYRIPTATAPDAEQPKETGKALWQQLDSGFDPTEDESNGLGTQRGFGDPAPGGPTARG